MVLGTKTLLIFFTETWKISGRPST
ncbi:hypothetical protein CAEBREN_21671 [Caenorhabditis brenneri]|uniref:Uncharacterized protein n=1 Tax=Caenorhabditis brenneri TaxID=135651 RepID=G0PI39_CAEBE|nr:hypothetical protein CAEBREN_21671 [Caenorhabditis brenneri]